VFKITRKITSETDLFPSSEKKVVRHLTIYVQETHLLVLRLLLSHCWFLCTKWPNHELRHTYTRYITQDYHNCTRKTTSRFQHSALTQQCNVRGIRTSGTRCCNKALFGWLHGLIHPLVSFPARIKGCYVTRAYSDVFLCSLLSSRRADDPRTTSSHQE